jgi:hypothetical protein
MRIIPRLFIISNDSSGLDEMILNSSENGFGKIENPALSWSYSFMTDEVMEPSFNPLPKLVIHISLALNGLKNTRSG